MVWSASPSTSFNSRQARSTLARLAMSAIAQPAARSGRIEICSGRDRMSATSAMTMSENCWSARALAAMSITCSQEIAVVGHAALTHPTSIALRADLPSRRFTLKRNVPREYATPALLRGLLPFHLAQTDAELAQMGIGHRRRRRSEQAGGRLGFREGHDVADGIGAAHQHHQAVEAEGEAAVGRAVERQRVQ